MKCRVVHEELRELHSMSPETPGDIESHATPLRGDLMDAADPERTRKTETAVKTAVFHSKSLFPLVPLRRIELRTY